MKTFIWTVIAMTSIDIVLGIIFLAAGRLPQLTNTSVAFGLFVEIVTIMWGAILLARA